MKFEDTIKEINKKYGDNTVLKVGEAKGVNVEAIPTGSYSLDHLLGCGGLPRGRIIEIHGVPSSGKSSLALFLVAEMQKRGLRALWVDAEYAFDKSYAKALGVDVDNLYLVQPGSGEEAMDILRKLINTNEFDIAVVDSVAALVPKDEIEQESIEKSTMALQARMMSKALRVLTPEVAKTKTSLLFINQLREKIGIIYGEKYTTPGGKALKFYASVRIKAWRKKSEDIKDDTGDTVGGILHLVASKNKVGPPFREADIKLYFGSGVDLVSDLLACAVKKKVVKVEGKTYSFGEEKLGVGKSASEAFLKTDDKLREKILKELKKYV